MTVKQLASICDKTITLMTGDECMQNIILNDASYSNAILQIFGDCKVDHISYSEKEEHALLVYLQYTAVRE